MRQLRRSVRDVVAQSADMRTKVERLVLIAGIEPGRRKTRRSPWRRAGPRTSHSGNGSNGSPQRRTSDNAGLACNASMVPGVPIIASNPPMLDAERTESTIRWNRRGWQNRAIRKNLSTLAAALPIETDDTVHSPRAFGRYDHEWSNARHRQAIGGRLT